MAKVEVTTPTGSRFVRSEPKRRREIEANVVHELRGLEVPAASTVAAVYRLANRVLHLHAAEVKILDWEDRHRLTLWLEGSALRLEICALYHGISVKLGERNNGRTDYWRALRRSGSENPMMRGMILTSYIAEGALQVGHQVGNPYVLHGGFTSLAIDDPGLKEIEQQYQPQSGRKFTTLGDHVVQTVGERLGGGHL